MRQFSISAKLQSFDGVFLFCFLFLWNNKIQVFLNRNNTMTDGAVHASSTGTSIIPCYMSSFHIIASDRKKIDFWEIKVFLSYDRFLNDFDRDHIWIENGRRIEKHWFPYNRIFFFDRLRPFSIVLDYMETRVVTKLIPLLFKKRNNYHFLELISIR